jgi:hypothetical protein
MNKIRPEMKDHPLAVAAREINDELCEKYGLQGICEKCGLKLPDLLYMAEQRALRALFASYGRNLQLQRVDSFQLSESEETLCRTLTSAYIDGLLIGWRAREIANLPKQTSKDL